MCNLYSVTKGQAAIRELVGVDALAQMRLWLSGEFCCPIAASEQVGLEDLRGCPEAEAFARRGIEARAELTEILLGERVRIGLIVGSRPTAFAAPAFAAEAAIVREELLASIPVHRFAICLLGLRRNRRNEANANP
jgi:hypothetical protein